MNRLLPRSLTSRLVVTAVALVAIVGLLVALSATLVMRGILTDRLDVQVRDVLRRAAPEFRGGPGDGPRNGRGDGRGDGPGATAIRQSPGTLIAVVYADPTVPPAGGVLEDAAGSVSALPPATIRELVALGREDRRQSIEISDTNYRILVDRDQNGNVYVVGLPSGGVDDTVSSMLVSFVLLTLLGVGIAGVAGTWLVRRQLRPLHAVAETARLVSVQDLSSGETTISNRVADDLTDPQTEVGQVGAALNTLLDHVDSALASRHRSEQQVRQFVADASHELRTPLSTIHGYAELSRRTPDDPAALGAALSKVETEAGRMSALVEDLLLLARLDAGRPLAREQVDVTRLLLEAVTDARVLAPGHHWRLDLPDEPVTVIGDEARLHQVATNLLSNARHHTPAGTTVTVRAVAQDAGALIEVHDDGPGLPPEILLEAFDRFTRGDSSRTRASGGSGLGLSLVSAIAAAHGGTAQVSSRPSDTTFTVAIPSPGAEPPPGQE